MNRPSQRSLSVLVWSFVLIAPLLLASTSAISMEASTVGPAGTYLISDATIIEHPSTVAIAAAEVIINGILATAGDVEITATERVIVRGTVEAGLGAAAAVPGTPGKSIFIQAPIIVIEPGAVLIAGDGTPGASSLRSSADPTVPAIAIGSDGGDGGNIVLVALRQADLQGTFVPGRGGDGGHADALAAAGTRETPDGGSAFARGGNGGAGGTANLEELAGQHLLASAQAGQGGDATAQGGAGNDQAAACGVDGADARDPAAGSPPPGYNADAEAQNGGAGCHGVNGAHGAPGSGASGGHGTNGTPGGNGGDAEAYGGHAGSAVCFGQNGGAAFATGGRGGDGGNGGHGGDGGHGSSGTLTGSLWGTDGGNGGNGGHGAGFGNGAYMGGGDAVAVGGNGGAGACYDGYGGSAIANAGNGGNGGHGGLGGTGGNAGCDSLIGNLIDPSPNQGGNGGQGGGGGHPGAFGIASATPGAGGGSSGEPGDKIENNGSWGSWGVSRPRASSGNDC